MSRLKCVGKNDYDDDDDYEEFHYDDCDCNGDDDDCNIDDDDCNDDDDDCNDDDYERHPTPLQEEHVLRKV